MPVCSTECRMYNILSIIDTFNKLYGNTHEYTNTMQHAFESTQSMMDAHFVFRKLCLISSKTLPKDNESKKETNTWYDYTISKLFDSKSAAQVIIFFL